MNLEIPTLVEKTLETMQKGGFEAYVVGGAVRDILLGKPTYDWDFTTDAQPDQIQELFPESFYDNKFGTVGITAEELTEQFNIKNYNWKNSGINPEDVFEITTFRSESDYTDHRRPDQVKWGRTLEDDLKRRDFTINAMALYKTEDNQWKIIDPFNGQADLNKRLIRAVGDPDQRFKEDALRMMRAIRIAAQLKFSIEEKTLKAINKNSRLIKKISMERVRDEFFKILCSDFPKEGILLLDSGGILEQILPELTAMKGIEQSGHHTKDVWNHSLDALAGCPSDDPIVLFATLLHDVGKPPTYRKQDGEITFYNHEVVGGRIAKKIADRFKLSKNNKQLLHLLVRFHMFSYDPEMSDKAIRRFIKRVGKENINKMMMLRIGDRRGGGSKATSWRLRELQDRVGKLMYTPLEVKDLKIDGNDVIEILDLDPGPEVGKILNQLFEEVMEDASKNKRDYLIQRTKELGGKI
jgi:putative nucleotidyltransferase with HDIG domain